MKNFGLARGWKSAILRTDARDKQAGTQRKRTNMKTITVGMLGKAYVAAMMNTTTFGLKRGGWVRLAKISSRSEAEVEPYVVAIRATNSETRPFQFGCSCPDWVHRRRGAEGISLCKHQRELIAHAAGTTPTKGIWLYKAGKAALTSLRENSQD